jgi:DNA adenine methylase
MHYLGGKTRIAKQLAAEIDKVRRPGQLVWDAFCGGLSMSVALSKNGPVLSTDACAPLITLYRAVQAGWDPPSTVSEEQYRAARSLPDTDPMKAFCGFGCSFGGKWFGGYARDGAGRNYAGQARAALMRDAPKLRFGSLNFLAQPLMAFDFLVYLDPPYRGMTGYPGAGPFNHDLFQARAVEWSRVAPVFVSEYEFPGVCVWEGRQATTIGCGRNGGSFQAVERLFYLPKQNAPEPTSSGANHPTNQTEEG